MSLKTDVLDILITLLTPNKQLLSKRDEYKKIAKNKFSRIFLWFCNQEKYFLPCSVALDFTELCCMKFTIFLTTCGLALTNIRASS